MKYYVNYNNFEDSNPHYGSFDSNHEMTTGKNHSEIFDEKEDAESFLKEKFNLEIEIE